MSKIRNPLGSVDQKVLAIVGDGDVTASQIRAAHKQVFGTDDGANACVVRFDRAGRLRSKTGELGFWGRRAAGMPSEPRAPRAAAVPIDAEILRLKALDAELKRLRKKFPNASDAQIEAAAETNLALKPPKAPKPPKEKRAPTHEEAFEKEVRLRESRNPLRRSDPRVRALVEERNEPISRADLRLFHEEIFGPRPTEKGTDQDAWDDNYDRCVPRIKRAHLLIAGRAPRAPGTPPYRYPAAPREPRAPADPLRKTDPRVREMVDAATSEGPIDRAGLRLVHEAVFGPRPEDGDERDAWDKNFERCVPRMKRAHLLLTKTRGEGPSSGKRVSQSEDDKANIRIMREARGELSCLKKHAIAVAKVDADACPLGRSKSEGDALRATKQAAVKNLDELWTSALKANSPMDGIKILGEAAELVREKFPGNRFGYETKAAGVLSSAISASDTVAAE